MATPVENRPVNRLDLIEVYGLRVPKAMPRIAIELLCYRTDRKEAQGGLGAEKHFRNAFQLMWPKYEMSEWVDLMLEAWCNYKWVRVIGHQRAGKTFSSAHIAFLDYCADPENTLTSLATVTFDSLRLRLWSDLQRAYETAKGMPVQDMFMVRSSTNELRLFPKDSQRESSEKYQIHGLAVNHTKDAEGRIRGGHAPRRRIIIDEAQDVGAAIYEALVNPMSAPDAKAVLLSNPVERVSKFGESCEPLNGWSSITDSDLRWECKRGGICLHFDGLQSPNVKHRGKRVFTGLLTVENVEEVRRIHGENSVQWFALIRGLFPPDGMISRLFSSSVIEKGKKPLAFDWRPVACAALDPAFESDNCVLMFGELAMPVFGVKRYAINVTESLVLKFDAGVGAEPKDYQCAAQVIRECKARGVPPENFLMDTTGAGRGVHAILWKTWHPDVGSVEFGGACTDRPITADNPKKADEMYMYFVTELWARTAACIADGLIGGLSNVDPRTIEDLYARRYELKQTGKGVVIVAEKKLELKKRLGRSPDFGDAFCLFGELLARIGTMAGARSVSPVSGKWDAARKRAIALSERSGLKEFSY